MAYRKQVAKENRTRPRQNGAKTNLSQFGLLEMPDLYGVEDGMGADDDDDDDNLEAELNAIISGKAPPKVTKKQKTVVDIDSIGRMAADCMKDPVGESFSDASLSGDEDLMAELHDLSYEHEDAHTEDVLASPSGPPRPQTAPMQPLVPQRLHTDTPVAPSRPKTVPEKPKESSQLEILRERLDHYKEAEAAARALGDNSKTRRYARGKKTLETLIKEATAGKPISEENIPPPVVIPKQLVPSPAVQPPVIEPLPPQAPKTPQQAEGGSMPAPPQRTTSITTVTQPEQQDKSDATHQMLCQRRDQYKMAALAAKKSGDMETAKSFVKISKQFQTVIEALESGQEVNLSNMPPPPPVQAAMQTSSAPEKRQLSAGSAVATDMPFQIPPEADGPEDPSLFKAPPPPSTILEALQQRLEKFLISQKSALAENDSNKARRLARIVKQYEVAIRDHKAGKTVDFGDLPKPPGFGPIPMEQKASEPAPSRSAPPVPAPKPPVPSATPPKPQAQKKPAGRSPSTLMDKQLSFLFERQKLFKAAALESKQKGDIQQAKEYLRMSKGFDPMVEATKCGLPIDATSIPTPPQLVEEYVVVEATQCHPDDMDKEENFRALERDLTRQIEICLRNKEHFLKLGDVSSASKFEKYCQDTRKDLLVVQNLWKSGGLLPSFHYENRIFSMVQCHSELADNEIQLQVRRGINLPGKASDLDSYVKIEFPFPSETPQMARTPTVKDTNNPEYNASFKFEINRKSRTLARVFKRHAVKLEVWSKGGFLRSDNLLGTASVKLMDLEKKCTLHDSFDLMEGRKACGGKLEVMLTLREPLLAKQIEEVREKWLVIGS